MECAQVTENKDYSYGPRPKYGTQAQRLAEPPSQSLPDKIGRFPVHLRLEQLHGGRGRRIERDSDASGLLHATGELKTTSAYSCN